MDCGHNTGFKDKNGRDIFTCNNVLLEGNIYEVTVNDFTKKIVVDGDCGQEELYNVFHKCEVIDN